MENVNPNENEQERLDRADAPKEEMVGPEIVEPAKKKATPGKIAMAVVAIVALAAMLIALIATGMNTQKDSDAVTVATEAVVEETVPATVPADGEAGTVTEKGTYTASDEEVKSNREIIVATIGENQLTNGELQVYYWSMVNSYLSSEYGYYAMIYGALDYTMPLDTQISAEDETMTWQQYFLAEALDYWQMSSALAEEAKENGVEMGDEDKEYLENLQTSLEETAASYGLTLEELLLSNVGPGAGVEEFAAFQRLYYEGKDFYQAALAEMTPTEQDLEEFFAANEELYTSNGITKEEKYVNARHILITPKGGTTDENGTTTYSDEEWAACEAEAQAILDEYLAGDKTEDSFAALAAEKTEDPGSQTTGGLYENIYEGQMVEPFENWCFDESRKTGDTGLVQTSYGYHVMYYVDSVPVWVSYAESGWITEQSNNFLIELAAKYPMEVNFSNIQLGFIDLGSN